MQPFCLGYHCSKHNKDLWVWHRYMSHRHIVFNNVAKLQMCNWCFLFNVCRLDDVSQPSAVQRAAQHVLLAADRRAGCQEATERTSDLGIPSREVPLGKTVSNRV